MLLPSALEVASNRHFQTIIKDFTEKLYKGQDASDRPDLPLAANVEYRHLLTTSIPSKSESLTEIFTFTTRTPLVTGNLAALNKLNRNLP